MSVTIQVFDPAMCCATGVCGPAIDPELARVSADLEWLRGQGVAVERFNLSQDPGAFAGAPLVQRALQERGVECLPLVLVDGLLSSVEVQAQTGQQSRKPVHAEFRSSVLDVDSASVAFTDGRIRTIQALGSPAQFSYVIKKSGRQVRGRAGKIDYDADKSEMRFSIDTWYSDGSSDATTEMLTYNINDGSMTTRKASGTYRPDEKVPAPRTPDRATAK